MVNNAVRIVLIPVCFATTLVACGGDDGRTPTPDAGVTDTGAEDVVVDTGPEDTGPPPPSELLEPCVDDSQCPEGFCRKAVDDGSHGGYCTRECLDRAPCETDVFNECVDIREEGRNTCERRCLNGIDCQREGYTCYPLPGSRFGYCAGVCTTDEECQAGGSISVCNRASGKCIAPDAPVGTIAVGDPCPDDAACASAQCLEEAGSTGFVGGYCLGACILPVGYNTSSFYGLPGLPQAGCGEGQVCFPNGSLTQGDVGVCLSGCGTDADCRDGYSCGKEFSATSGIFDVGVCLPVDCATEACPAGYECTTINTSSGPIQRCQP